MIPFRKTLGFRLLGISIILLALPVLVDSFIFLYGRYSDAIEKAHITLEEEVSLRSDPFHQKQININKVFSMLIYFLGFEHEVNDHEGKLHKELQQFSAINFYHELMIIKFTKDKRFIKISSSLDEETGEDITPLFQNPFPFSAAARKRGYTTSFMHNPKTDQLHEIISKGIYSKEGEPVGLIVVMKKFKKEGELMLKSEYLPYPVNFALILPSSIIFDASESSFRFNYFDKITEADRENFAILYPDETIKNTPLVLDQSTKRPYISFKWNGEQQLGILKKLVGTNNQILAYVSLKDVERQPLHALYLYYGVILAIFILGVLIAYIGTRRLTAPISRVSQVMHKVKGGELQERFEKHPLGFEINTIGVVFNEMVDTLIEKERLIQEERVIKETYFEELALGQKVQESLLPKQMPKVAGIELAQAFAPAISVGGDFYDAYIKENGKLMLAVADASGKGVQACCYSLSLKNMLATLACQSDDVAEVSRKTNNLFCEDTGDTGMFVTVLLGQYDPETRQFDYYSSGHNAPMLYSAETQSVEMLDFLDMAMGVLEKEKVQKSKTLTLKPKDVLVLYSDGVTEAHSPKAILYGEERLMQFIQREAHKSAKEIAALLMDELATFAGKADQHDDITIVILKVE